MFHEIFLTKERKIVAVILSVIIIVTVVLFLNQYSKNKNYKEQTVMANEYLRDGNFKQAIDVYLKVISMRSNDKETLTIKLSEAYIGIGNYDKALEVLRSCYQITAGVKIKEKIEEVTLRKTDYEYLQIISRADKYFTNGEYDKAISEYQKAKLIKSKEPTSYRCIAEAYIKNNDYTAAHTEVMDGLAVTRSNDLYEILDKINRYLTQQHYNEIIIEADEYIDQENYDDGIEKYREAIQLMPKAEKAYLSLAKTYLSLYKYEDAIVLINEGLVQSSSEELESILEKAKNFKAVQDKRREILSELYVSVNPLNIKKVTRLMNTAFFQKNIAAVVPVYYSSTGEGIVTTGKIMIINNKDNFYYGMIKDGVKMDFGIYFTLINDDNGQGYYYYKGNWKNNKPDGLGMTEEQNLYSSKKGKLYKIRTVTDGVFIKGLESGSMHKSFYHSGKLNESIQYDALEGIPEPMMGEDNQPIRMEDDQSYAIAELYQEEEATGEYYMVKPKTIWGVKPFMKD